MRWLRSWLRFGGWKHRAAAKKKQELLNPQAVALGLSITDAILNRRNICRTCHSIFIPKERPFSERFQVRSILRIQDSLPDPMLCDYCFDNVTASYNRFQNNIGTSNCGPPNLILQRSVEKS